MFAEALRPKAVFKALVTYYEREQAKKEGFKWIPQRKSWERKMAIEDSKKLPFQVELLEVCQ
jgi:DNA polymerase-3 subunit epsilon